MKESEKDLVRLLHILKSIELINEFTSDIEENEFLNDELIQSAVIRQFEIIGEAVSV